MLGLEELMTYSQTLDVKARDDDGDDVELQAVAGTGADFFGAMSKKKYQ